MNTAWVVLAALLGLVAGLLAGRWSATRGVRATLPDADAALHEDARQAAALSATLAAREEELDRLRDAHHALQTTLEARQAELRQAQAQAAALDARLQAQATLEESLRESQRQVEQRFALLAQAALDAKQKQLDERGAASLEPLLGPLREQIERFRKQVEEAYGNEARERFALHRELDRLMQMNRQLSDDARGLADALRGKSQLQGAWGELILERLLESAGLERGREFELQRAFDDEVAGRRRPDAILYLPENRHLVIDAKVSLVAYERWCGACDESAATGELKAHVASLRAHLAGLAERGYESLKGLNTPDFTLLFVPVEGAFSAALRGDDRLFEDAYQRKILIVSPTTLLVVVRMVSYLWRQDRVTRNTQAIVEQGRLVYDKLRGFLGDFEGVGRSLRAATDRYDAARAKLSEGRGNLVDRVEKLTTLGVSPAQRIGPQWLAPGGGDPDDPDDEIDTPTQADPAEAGRIPERLTQGERACPNP